MTDLHPSVQKIKDKFFEQLAYKKRIGIITERNPIERRKFNHAEYEQSWIPDVPMHDGFRYFTIYYCPDCLLGWVGGTTYDKPDTESARELGLINKTGEWSTQCRVKDLDGHWAIALSRLRIAY